MAEALEANSVIEIAFKDSETAKVAMEALKVEGLLPKASRAEVDITHRKNILSLDINARDTAALRAAINSFLRWAAIARDMTKYRRS